MMDSEKIYGQKILQVFENLEKDRTVLNLHVIGEEYERLTILTGRVLNKEKAYFLIDYPKGFKEAVGDGKNKRLFFQFIASDKIRYRFRTTFTKITRKDVWVKFPDYIERIQRRKFFRIAPPMGTTIFFYKGAERCEASVVNISEGGVLLSHNGPPHEGLDLFKDEPISDLHLRCIEKSLKFELDIDKAVIMRVEHIPEVNRMTYALQFVGMDKTTRNDLGDWIYRCQRDFLRRRNLLDGR